MYVTYIFNHLLLSTFQLRIIFIRMVIIIFAVFTSKRRLAAQFNQPVES